MGLRFTSQDDLANQKILFCLQFPMMPGHTHGRRDPLRFSNRHPHQMALGANWNLLTSKAISFLKGKLQSCKRDYKYVKKWPTVLGFAGPDLQTRILWCPMMGGSSQDEPSDDATTSNPSKLSVSDVEAQFISLCPSWASWGSCLCSFSRINQDRAACMSNLASQHGGACGTAHTSVLEFLPPKVCLFDRSLPPRFSCRVPRDAHNRMRRS